MTTMVKGAALHVIMYMLMGYYTLPHYQKQTVILIIMLFAHAVGIIYNQLKF